MIQKIDSTALSIDPRDQMPLTLQPHIMTVIRVTIWIGILWVWGRLVNTSPEAAKMPILVASLVPMTLFFWAQPAYGLISLMFFASGFLEPDFVDVRLPIRGGFEMRDILVLLLFGMALIKQLTLKRVVIPLRYVGLSLLVFFLVVLFSLFKALFLEKVASNWALSDARILSFYLIFFIAAWTINTESTLATVIIGSFVIADMMAVIILVQQYLGPYNYLIPSMNDSSWQIWLVNGAVRVVPPGIVYIYFMNLVSIALLIFGHYPQLERIFLILHSLLLTLALLFTFTRSAWVASSIAIVLMLPFVLLAYRHFLLRILLLSGAAALFLVGSAGLLYENSRIEHKAAQGIVERFSTIFTVEDTLETNSLQWRLFESQEARKALSENFWTGVGLGNSYRPITVFQGEAQGAWTDNDISDERIDRFTRYVHTSYLALAVKLGVPALILLLCFVGLSILKGFSMFMTLPNGAPRGIVLAVSVGLIGLLQWSILHAHLMLASSTAVVGLVIGLIASIHTIYIRNTTPNFVAT